MVPIKALGSVLGLANGAWAAFIAETALNRIYNCPAGGCPASLFAYVPYAEALAAVGAVLVVDSVVSFKGFRVCFLLAALLSVGVLGLVGLEWGTYGGWSLPACILAVAAAAVGTVASRGSKGMPDEAHPLELPVFG